jgi:hypothetical protein
MNDLTEKLSAAWLCRGKTRLVNLRIFWPKLDFYRFGEVNYRKYTFPGSWTTIRSNFFEIELDQGQLGFCTIFSPRVAPWSISVLKANFRFVDRSNSNFLTVQFCLIFISVWVRKKKFNITIVIKIILKIKKTRVWLKFF